MTMYEFLCLECRQIQRWERDASVANGGIPQFCAACGSSRIEQKKFDAYWYDLADAFGFERSANGAEFIHSIYRLWQPSEHSKFRDFVMSLDIGAK